VSLEIWVIFKLKKIAKHPSIYMKFDLKSRVKDLRKLQNKSLKSPNFKDINRTGLHLKKIS